MAVADAGATRLIEILEWALQVARIWRRSGGPKKQELMEEVSPGSESVPLGQSFGRLRHSVATDAPQSQTTASSAFSPVASMTSLAPPKRPRRLSLFRRQSSLSLIPDPASAKPFDALLHFLPADVPDKTRLKAMILVTTLTRPYLAVPPTRARSMRFYSESSSKLSTSSSKSGKRWSFFRSTSNVTSPSNSSSTLSGSGQSKSTTDLTEGSRNRSTSLTNLALLRARRSRLVHLMPSASVIPTSSRHPVSNSIFPMQVPAQAHLIRNIEAFLLSFCFSASPELPSPIAGFAASDADCGKARPYIVPMSALAEVLQVQSHDGGDEVNDEGEESGKKRSDEWTLAELILSGALEGESEFRASSGLRSGTNTERSSSEIEKGKGRQVESNNTLDSDTAWMSHRAWIGSVRDIVIGTNSTSRRSEKAHIVPSRSTSQPLLPSQSHSHSYSNQPQSPPRSQAPSSSRSQPISGPVPLQGLNRAGPVRGTQFPTSTSPPRAALYVDTKRRRVSKKRGYQSLAIEKRLPTPPEDENEDEELEEDYGVEADVDSTISNATSCTRSPYPDDDYMGRDATPRVSEWAKDGFANGRADRYPSERTEPYDYSREGYHQRYELYSRSNSNGVMSSSSGYPSTSSSSSSTSTPSTITHSVSPSHHYRSSSQHQHQSERNPPSQAHVYVQGDEKINGKARQQENNYMPNDSLPTPPDSDKASFEGVVTDSVTPPASAQPYPSHERERKYIVAEPPHAPTPSSKQSREETRRELAGSHATDKERERERERRKRAYSQPTRPPPPIPMEAAGPAIPAAADERVPPRRSKSKPKEKEGRVSKDYPPFPVLSDTGSRSKATMERRTSGVGAILNKPLRPDLKRNSAGGHSSGDRQREHRHGKLEKKPSKSEIRSESRGNGSSVRESRDRKHERERRGSTSAYTTPSANVNVASSRSAIKRVPVPAVRDVLPALPRSSAPPAMPTSTSRSPTPQQSRSRASTSQGLSVRMARSPPEGAIEAQQYRHQDHHTKWKFWKGGPGSGAVVNT